MKLGVGFRMAVYGRHGSQWVNRTYVLSNLHFGRTSYQFDRTLISIMKFISKNNNFKYQAYKVRDTRCDKSLRHVAATSCCNKSPHVTCDNNCRYDRILSLQSVA